MNKLVAFSQENHKFETGLYRSTISDNPSRKSRFKRLFKLYKSRRFVIELLCFLAGNTVFVTIQTINIFFQNFCCTCKIFWTIPIARFAVNVTRDRHA